MAIQSMFANFHVPDARDFGREVRQQVGKEHSMCRKEVKPKDLTTEQLQELLIERDKGTMASEVAAMLKARFGIHKTADSIRMFHTQYRGIPFIWYGQNSGSSEGWYTGETGMEGILEFSNQRKFD